MRELPGATLEAMSGYRAQVWEGEPPMACISLSDLEDMHEAIEVEQENERRAYEHARKKANEGKRR